MYEKLQELYASSTGDVRGRCVTPKDAYKIYGNYLSFIARAAPPPNSLLDVGCGNGWSTYLFSECGYNATGVDLNAAFFEPTCNHTLKLNEASVLALPFSDGSFDVVSANQMLEHVPDPAAALSEMLRVLKPGGVICIVGPNLISPLGPLRGITRYAWRNRPFRRIFIRDAYMPKHPGGNTFPEAVVSLVRNTGRVIKRSFSKNATFEMREPDLVPPFHADNDACYYCNPLDIAKFFESQGSQIIMRSKPGRLPFTWALAGGTWIAARK